MKMLPAPRTSTMKLARFCASSLVAGSLAIASPSWACPKIDGLIDYNCDGKIRIAMLGDSFVYGTGDTRPGSKGGYIGRLAKLPEFKNAEIVGLGLPGYSSFEILIEVRRSLGLAGTNRIKRTLSEADFVGIDLGRNDFFRELSPNQTVANIRSLIGTLNQKLGHGARLAPQFAIAKISSTSPARRPLQRAFISKVDSLLTKKNSATFPVRLGFDALNPRLLSSDGLHPAPSGYNALTKILATYILGAAQEEEKNNRTDVDLDGVYDQAESTLFQTDPASADTDSDGLNDGQEIFSTKTDPLLFDTDSDSFSDGAEVTAGSDPMSSASFPG